MSTATAFQLVGTVIGSYFGPVGAAVGGTVGALIGNAIAPTAVAQPSLNDLKIQRPQPGTQIPYVWGRFRVAMNPDWIGNNGELIPHGGGGGGKGGGEPEQTTYTASWSGIFNKSTRKGQKALEAIDKWWTDGRVVNLEDINPTVYTGWPLQLPDSSKEADLGVGRVSADRFKGTAVFNDVQMGQFFNRLPNMEALVRTVAQTNAEILQLASENAGTAFAYYPRFTSIWSIDWSTSQTLPEPSVTSDPNFYYEDLLGAHRITRGSQYKYANGTTVDLWQDFCTPTVYCPIGGKEPSEGPWPYNYNIAGLSAMSGSPIGGVDICYAAGVEAGRFVESWCTSQDRTILIVITTDDNIAPTERMWHKIVDGTMVDEGPVGTGISTLTSAINIGCGDSGDNVANTVKGVVESNGQYIWVFRTNGGWYTDDEPAENQQAVGLFYIDSADSTLKQYDAGDEPDSYGGPAQSGAASGAIYCPADGYCATVIGGQTQYALYTRFGGGGEVTLAQILADVFELRNGLTPDQFDVSQAESTIVHGAALASVMQKRNFIDSLRQAYFFDIVESDDGESVFLKVVMRDQEEPEDGWEEIPDDDLGVREEGEEPKALLELLSRVQEAELPARVNVQYYDPAQDYQVGSQSAQWNAPYVDNVTRIDLPIAMPAGEARAIAKKHLALARLERNRYGFSTSRKWAHLEPGDIRKVHGLVLRLLQKTETPKGVVRWEAVQHAPYISNQVEDGAPADGTTPPAPDGPKVATQVKFFDVAKLADDHLDIGFYVAAAPAVSGGTWKGYSLQKSVDGGASWAEVSSTATATVMGTVEQPIGAFTGGNVFDYSTVIRVTGLTGTLESVTELAALNGENAYILGNEWGNFTTATQVDATTWDVSGLLRGRRGTEWSMASHGVNETFALASTLLNVATPAAEVGVPRVFKAVTFGMTVASATEMPFTNTAQSARCYAPVHLAGGPTASSAMLFECQVRTRDGGAWRDLVDVTQADAPLNLVLEIWDANYTNCARVVSGLTTPSYSYSSADQTADFGALQSRYYFTWAQVGQFGLGIRARGSAPGPGSTIDAPVDPGDPYEPPADPPVGGGAVDIELDYPIDNVQSSGFKIGDTLVAHFTTTTAPASGYISVACLGSPYAMRLIIATDIDGTDVVKQIYGNPAATIALGTMYSWSVPLDPATEYFVIVRHELAPGAPSGTPGTAADIAITLFTE